MSWKATAWAKEVSGISRSEKLLLLVIADYYNEDEKAAWPSLASLATHALMSRRHVMRLLAKLEERGVVKLDKQRGHLTRIRLTRDIMSPVTSDVTTPRDIWMSPEPQIQPPVDDDQKSELITEVINQDTYSQFVNHYHLQNPIGAPSKYWAASGDIAVSFNQKDLGVAVNALTAAASGRQLAPMPSWLPALASVGHTLLRTPNRSTIVRRAVHSIRLEQSIPDDSWLSWVATHPDTFLATCERETLADPGR